MYLKVQNYLTSFSNPARALESLNSEYGIKFEIEDDLVILNYDMIQSSSGTDIENECRALILSYPQFEVVSKSFYRFLNYGEKNAAKIDWNSAKCLTKFDGSLMCAYHWKGSWHCQTRKKIHASGELPVSIAGTFADAFWRLIPNPDSTFLDTSKVYVFEYIGPYNRIVSEYSQEELILLTVFDRNTGKEHYKDAQEFLNGFFRRPTENSCSSLEEAKKLLEPLQNTDEGWVVIDKNLNRIKVKNPNYLVIAKTVNAGGSLNSERLVEIYFSDSRDEVVSYFPEIEEKFLKLEEFLQNYISEVNRLWEAYSKLDRKSFALAVKDTPQAAFLFDKYTGKADDVTKWFLGNKNRLVRLIEREA